MAGGAVVAGGAALLTREPAASASAPTVESVPVLAYDGLGTGTPLPSSIPADASPEFRTVAEALLAMMTRVPIPGAALGVLHDGREEYAYFGVESLNSHVTVGPDTLFQLGSLSKTYTATAIWRLIDEGTLRLDAPVREYLPALKMADEETAARVTIANLLDHTAGFYGSDGAYVGENDQAIARYVDQILPTLPQIFPLGAFPSYNNDGFTLLGRLIEVVHGSTYLAGVNDLVIGPLGLTSTLLDRPAVMGRRHVDGHYQGPIGSGEVRLAVQTPLFLPRAVEPAGGLWATPTDVLAYGRFHLSLGRQGPGSGIVSADSLQQMQDPAQTWPGLDIRIGRNWFVQEEGGVTALSHNGDTAGCHAVFVAFPEQQLAVVLLVNVSGGIAAERAVLNAVATTYPGLQSYVDKLGLTQSFIALGSKPVTLPAAELARYAGTYSDPGQTMTIATGGPQGAPMSLAQTETTRPNAFTTAITPPPAPTAPLTFADEDVALVNGIEKVSFVRNSAGEIGWLARGLRITPRTGNR